VRPSMTSASGSTAIVMLPASVRRRDALTTRLRAPGWPGAWPGRATPIGRPPCSFVRSRPARRSGTPASVRSDEGRPLPGCSLNKMAIHARR
jgi:hypothetical protein